MQDNRPNIILIMADQFRYDAIASHDHPFISTPTLDQMISKGTDFSNAYSATPTCLPARASMLSGLKASNTGIVGYKEGADWDFPNKLGQVFADRGYYAKAIGKMHVSPARNTMGFHHVELHDGYLHFARDTEGTFSNMYEGTDDYLYWLKQHKPDVDLTDLGLDCNSWVARPFSLEEKYHPTNWVTSRAIRFLDERDPTKPFFLKTSYVRPHQPLDPPEHYFNMYYDEIKKIDGPKIAQWAKELGVDKPVEEVDALTGTLNIGDYRRMLAGYYGLITHIDHQINRFLIHLQEHQLLNKSIIIFLSDHGDQLGQDAMFRKGFPYQASAHIPFIVYDPGQFITKGNKPVKLVDKLVVLEDILPSLVDFATGDLVEGVDGMSVKPLIQGKKVPWRDYIHGEHVLGDWSNQFIIKDGWKYIWYTQTGVEQLFNLNEDPTERLNLVKDNSAKNRLLELRDLLIKVLEDRPEGFVKDSKLIKGRKQDALIPPQKDSSFYNKQ